MKKMISDEWRTNFSKEEDLYIEVKSMCRKDEWMTYPVNSLRVISLENDRLDSAHRNFQEHRYCCGEDTMFDTMQHTSLALASAAPFVYPLRNTAIRTLLERAKISGNSLAKLPKEQLAQVVNYCLQLYPNAQAWVLIRGEKICAVHSGSDSYYSILPADQLLERVKAMLDQRFPKHNFWGANMNHSLLTAAWTLPEQKSKLIDTYFDSNEVDAMPVIRFSTSDVGISSARLDAIMQITSKLSGTKIPMLLGDCLSLDHRNFATVEDFEAMFLNVFAKFSRSVSELAELQEIWLEYPVNVMTKVAEKYKFPKKAAAEAIRMFANTRPGTVTAFDVYTALWEIPFLMGENKNAALEETMARIRKIDWSAFDLPIDTIPLKEEKIS